MAQSHAGNDMSGTVHGPVVQAGTVHGGIHVGPGPSENLEYLAPGMIQIRLSKSSPHEAATSLARLDPRKAADVILLTQRARRIEIMTSMDTASATAIIQLLDDTSAEVLRAAMRAAHAIATDAAQWHKTLGDASGDLALRETSRRGTTGYASHYERGTVYWSERTGTGMVAGRIKKRFWELDGLSGLLGYPIGPETQAAKSRFGTTGTFQRFESTWDYSAEALEKTVTVCGGTIYASDKGVFATRGGIGQYFEASGGTWGPLGFPLSEEEPLIDLYGAETEFCCQRFEGGTVYWGEERGVASVKRPIADFHKEAWLVYGLPVSDQVDAVPSRWGTGGVVQQFDGPGRPLICSSALGTWAVSGATRVHFEEHGATGGLYGFPAGREKPRQIWQDRGVMEQHFENGAIFCQIWPDTIGIGVTGVLYGLWRQHEGELGAPTAPERTIGDGPDLVQTFQSGIITVIDGVASYWMAPDPESETTLPF